MPQKRNESGPSFEKEVCIQKNLTHFTKKPLIKWSGKGKSNYEKIASVNCNSDLFYTLDTSVYEKCDAIDLQNHKREIKKYYLHQISKWTLYSEPFPTVKDRDQLENITQYLGNGCVDLARSRFNKFIGNLMKRDFEYIIEKITSSNIGIQLIDAFIPSECIEFKIITKNDWQGFDRAQIVFRKKIKSDIPTHPPIISKNSANISIPVEVQASKKTTKKRVEFDYLEKIKSFIENNSHIPNLGKHLTETHNLYEFEKLPDRVKKEERYHEVIVNGEKLYLHTKDDNKTKKRKLKNLETSVNVREMFAELNINIEW